MSTKTSAIDFFPIEGTNRLSLASAIPLGKEFIEPLVAFRSKLFILAQRAQVIGHQPAHGSIMLSSFATCPPINFVADGYRDVLHIGSQ